MLSKHHNPKAIWQLKNIIVFQETCYLLVTPPGILQSCLIYNHDVLTITGMIRVRMERTTKKKKKKSVEGRLGDKNIEYDEMLML